MHDTQPRHVWDYFQQLSGIPRASGREHAAAQWVLDVAARHGAQTACDATGNVVVRVPASPGREHVAVTVLQGHLDMVCEKNADVAHDFACDPIRLVVSGDLVRASGTTLGADNGIGVAMALALLDMPEAVHGPLELLFTVDEERGLNGAKGLAPHFLTGRRLINLDTEEDGAIYVGCAGGVDTVLSLPIERAAAVMPRVRVAVQVSGLRGGHSGGDIHEGRGNANRLLERALHQVFQTCSGVHLVAIHGGSLPNAIPREASAVLDVAPGDLPRLHAVVADFAAIARLELAGVDDGVQLTVAESLDGSAPLTVASAERALRLLAVVPHGLTAFSRSIPDLVETSTNFAVIRTSTETLVIHTSQRSSVPSQLEWIRHWVGTLASAASANVVHADGYPGWPPSLESPLLRVAQQVFGEELGSVPQPRAVHAGLECGLIGARVPGMDMISIGPDIRDAHSPDESVSISSVARTWLRLLALLERLD